MGIASSTARPRAAALLLMLAGCAGMPEEVTLVGPLWVAEAIDGKGVAGDPAVNLQFDPDGKAGGSGGCNNFGGAYTVDHELLSFGAIAATRRACATAVMDQEQTFFSVLERVTHHEIRDGTLLLMTDDGKVISLRRT